MQLRSDIERLEIEKNEALASTTQGYNTRLKKVVKNLKEVRLDIGQFRKIMNAVKNCDDITLGLILGQNKENEVEKGLEPVEQVEKLSEWLKNGVIELRNCISDFYAQRLGTNCVTQ